MSNEDETKEDFCPACLVVPLAFAGASATAAGGTMSKSHKKWKKMLLISGIVSVLISAIILIYYFMNKENCAGKCNL